MRHVTRELARTLPRCGPLVLAAVCLGCGAAPHTEVAEAPVTPASEALAARVVAALAGTEHPRVDTALAAIDRRDPLETLAALEPLRSAEVAPEEQHAAHLWAAVAATDLGITASVRAAAGEVLADASSPASHAVRVAALQLLASGHAGPPGLWLEPCEYATGAELVAALDALPFDEEARVAVASALMMRTPPELDHAGALLALPAAEASPAMRWVSALSYLQGGERARAREALDALARGGGPYADRARILLAHLAVRAASEVRETVYDSPRFHGDAARAILRDAAATLASVPAASPLFVDALNARVTLLLWAGDHQQALSLFGELPALGSADVLASHSARRLLDSGDVDWAALCAAPRASEAELARLIALAEAWSTDGSACRSLESELFALPRRVPAISAYSEPVDARAWLVSTAVRDHVSADREGRADAARAASLPASFRSSEAGARVQQDVVIAASFAADQCDEHARGLLQSYVTGLEDTLRYVEAEWPACTP